MIAIPDDLPPATEGAVDRERQPDRKPVHAAARAPRFVAFDDEVAVVLLDREVDHSEPIEGRARDGASKGTEHARRSK
jgi:hypothetical protein